MAEPTPTPVAAAPAATGELTLDGLKAAMAFSAAPEIINGRLAMLGFVAALGAELASGKSVVAQMSMDQPQILFHFALFAAASLIPIMKGAKEEEFGPFSPKAELLNGRAAMIGFALLLVLEGSSGSAFF